MLLAEAVSLVQSPVRVYPQRAFLRICYELQQNKGVSEFLLSKIPGFSALSWRPIASVFQLHLSPHEILKNDLKDFSNKTNARLAGKNHA